MENGGGVMAIVGDNYAMGWGHSNPKWAKNVTKTRLSNPSPPNVGIRYTRLIFFKSHNQPQPVRSCHTMGCGEDQRNGMQPKIAKNSSPKS